MSQKVNESVGQADALGARCSAAVPGCGFQHRPGACRFRNHRQAAGRHLNPQAWTPALRESPNEPMRSERVTNSTRVDLYSCGAMLRAPGTSRERA